MRILRIIIPDAIRFWFTARDREAPEVIRSAEKARVLPKTAESPEEPGMLQFSERKSNRQRICWVWFCIIHLLRACDKVDDEFLYPLPEFDKGVDHRQIGRSLTQGMLVSCFKIMPNAAEPHCVVFARCRLQAQIFLPLDVFTSGAETTGRVGMAYKNKISLYCWRNYIAKEC